MDRAQTSVIGAIVGAVVGLTFPLAIGYSVGQEETCFGLIVFSLIGGGVGALGKKMTLIFLLLLFAYLFLALCALSAGLT